MKPTDERAQAAKALYHSSREVLEEAPELTEQADPFVLFAAWFDAAKRSGLFLPEAICLATSTPDGRPSARMMLLKGHGPDGFVFYTNHESRKGGELQANPHVALVMHWPMLERSVRIEGAVQKMTPEESDGYFQTRERGSRIGAWASRQSHRVDNRAELEKAFEETEARFDGQSVPIPPFWGGWRVTPSRIEFWQGRPFRLHDRLVFERIDADAPWSAHRLCP